MIDKIREALRQYINVAWSEEDIIELRPRPNGLREWIRAAELLEPERIERLVSENKAGANIFAGILPRERKGDGSAKDIKGGRVVWVDYDHITPEEAIMKADSKGCPPPSMVVNTGHGAHLFWKLDGYTPAADINIFLKRFATFVGADTAATDLSRILRLPGFQNTKDTAEEVYASVVYAEESCVYTLKELQKVLPEAIEVEVKSAENAEKNTISWDYSPDRQIKRGRAYVDTIPGESEGGRNRACFRVACVLINDLQINDSDAYSILSAWDSSRNNPPLQSESTGEKELRSIIDSAKKNAKKEAGALLLEEPIDVELPTVFSNTPKAEPEIKAEEPKAQRISENIYERFLNPGGTLQLMCDFINAGSYCYQPELALGCALVSFGVILGRIVCDEQNTRTNLYVAGIAPSSTGKNRALEAMKIILMESNISKLLGPSGFKSGSAIIKTISKQKKCLSLMDELGIFFGGVTVASKVSSHAMEINKNIMELYSCSNNVYVPPAAAGYESESIEQPCLGIYGCSTPGKFYESLSIDSVESGFLPRFILIDGREDPDESEPECSLCVPNKLKDAIHYWGDASLRAGGVGNVVDIKQELNPVLIEYTFSDEVKEYYKTIAKECRKIGKRAGDPWTAMWGRVVEKGKRIALIHACSLRTGVVTMSSARYGIEFAQVTTEKAIQTLQGELYENLAEKNLTRLLKFIKLHTPVPKAAITNNTRWFRNRYERDDAIATLVEAGQIKRVESNDNAEIYEVL